jgi:mannose/cellobiose epimerase-like protein (N-acyl-D-glucosamine 2-epimerase family)
MSVYALASGAPRWTTMPTHRLWLLKQADAILDLFEQGCLNRQGGFHELDDAGRPYAPGEPDGNPPSRLLHITTRTVHCFAIAHLMGRPGADRFIDHGMDFIWNGHRDTTHGGYIWGIGYGGPTDPTKQAYGHAHVLLAGASAKVAGHPDADRLIADVTQVLLDRFWEQEHGAVAEEFNRDWTPYDTYRGQNSNMHLTESLMAAYEVTLDSTYLRMAERISALIINRHARASGWRVAEHFTDRWELNREYSASPMFRPAGTTPGHSLEWVRLLLQLWELGGRKLDWIPEAARAIFEEVTTSGWDKEKGGFYYTMNWDGSPRIRDRYWWPCCEAIGASAFLGSIDGDALYETWYRRVWSFTTRCFIDPVNGGWRGQVDDDLKPNSNPFYGKPDIYHCLQACLIPLLPTTGSITKGLAEQGIRL